MIWGEVPRGLVIIIVVLFKKKNDIFFKAVKAADDIPRELGKLWRGGILSFQRQMTALSSLEHVSWSPGSDTE